MHIKRILSGLAALPCFYLIVSHGGIIAFTLLVFVAAMIGMWEYYGLVFSKSGESRFGCIPSIGYVSGTAIIWAWFFTATPFDWIVGILIVTMLVSAMAGLLLYAKNNAIMDTVAKQVQSVVYIPLLLSTLLPLRMDADNGSVWIYFILILVAACDTGAFYAGTYLGKHKLCPSVSPGKTIEGLIGGIGLAVITGAVMKYFFLPEIGWLPGIVFFIVVGLIGPAGDLFESVLKRAAGMKDSGAIIPGHGGILDRIDALLFVAPVAYMFKLIFNY